ncbi:hypothetical protein [Ruegeria sp.]|uniref:hypothetical protein n=1 Tax=Ruegeria sp. TaxID=1879320 RepID=UPI003B5A8C72
MMLVFYILPFLFVIPIIWIMVKAFMRFERSKKAIIEGVASLGADKLDLLGWKAGQYVNIWEALPFLGSDWQAANLRLRDQMQTLQRVAVHGLPICEEIDASVRKSARIFRLFFWIIGMPGLSVVYLVGSAKIGAWLGSATSSPPVIWFAAMVVIVCVGFILPFDKYKKWPKLEDTP